MRKITVFILVMLLLSLFLPGCGTEEPAPTGYPDGEIQYPMIFVCGTLYVPYAPSDESDVVTYLAEMPYGYVLHGEIAVANNLQMPAQEFHASRMDVGTELYVSSESDAIIYAVSNNGRIIRFQKCSQEEYLLLSGGA